ncbi:LLM class flavin-dependent oxidoreductase [Terracoccus luteus]|uniref:Alkanesulfonate monooxygenase SsuD/methylene tetrahydromethanopterin reductase-like flavin-dependent oxidoreductase (Luciferase family) n=1 Tax=Terracoccus luteus TaxID=53356 RepID=A0A839Q261_9MICO|nr:LLM class flavin-dependent oxidoreductase [Terracoccus luteus]MBB2988415.1 alkanesulfonate monooxygenase SsuD/methylene tetrahydromethanopterin reductase-like flavin-dependent oxidoreductase (luciferase family) [Terracoccus luteus]MCP2174058.1 alkanesulfonate monooxygenase SsuD/methylene tetrahydromethanopterin reductase-like flavin-dependent oxidoreductase (luciferase family) [Terracoccus luteus]
MRFGLTILPEHPWPTAVSLWRETEAMGFDHGWTFDHVTWGGLPDSPWFAALPTLAAVAATTERLTLGTFVTSPNNHHPVQLMREVLALHDISGGRFLLGLGTGGDLDSRAMGDDLTLRNRVDRFHEFTDLLDRLLSGDHVDADGEYYRARDVRTLPGPVRGAEPVGVPFLVAANGPRSIRLAATRGDGWLTYGGPADTGEQWWSLVEQAAGRVTDALAAAGRTGDFPRYLNIDAGPTFTLTSVDAFEDAVGRAADLGFTDVITHWPRAEGPFAGRREVLEHVASEVLPRWRSTPGAGAGATSPDAGSAR